MIMAGRGQRLKNVELEPEKVGIPKTSPTDELLDLPSMIKKINEINIRDINPSVLVDLQNQFKQIFTSKEALRCTLSDLHTKALQDADFGEKLVVVLEPILNLEIDGTLLRGELLSFIQNDFKAKEANSESDPKIFVNSVMLLGNVFSRVKVCGAPIAILGVAMIEYFDILIKGDEEQLKTLTKQVLMNGSLLSQVNKYELLDQILRTTLITKDLNSPSKCWILLAIDFMSNGFKPLKGPLREFYIKNLGNEFEQLEAYIPVPSGASQSPISPGSVKSPGSTPTKNKSFSTNSSGSDGFKSNLNKKFSEMKVTSGSGKKEKFTGKTNKRNDWKSGVSGRGSSGHDDRFDKEEHFYGVQRPREAKPNN